MPITWNEARDLEAQLQREQDERAMREREANGKIGALARFPIGSTARITRLFHDGRVWGDTVTITAYCPFDGNPGVCADHEAYGDVGWVFGLDELTPE